MSRTISRSAAQTNTEIHSVEERKEDQQEKWGQVLPFFPQYFPYIPGGIYITVLNSSIIES